MSKKKTGQFVENSSKALCEAINKIASAKGVEETQIDFLNSRIFIPSETKNMGIGKLVDKETMFARKFRWTLGSQHLPEDYIKRVSFDYVNQQITFEYYDVKTKEGGFDALLWAWQLKGNYKEAETEELVFITYDGCGNPLYSTKFRNLRLDNHTSDFDYASNDMATQIITVHYMNSYLITNPKDIKLDQLVRKV